MALYLQSLNPGSSLRSFLTHWSLPVFNHFGTARKRACFGPLHFTQRTGIPPSGSMRFRNFVFFVWSIFIGVCFRCSCYSMAVRNLHCSRYGSISCLTGRYADLKRHPCFSLPAGQKARQAFGCRQLPSIALRAFCLAPGAPLAVGSHFVPSLRCNPFVPHSLHLSPHRWLKAVFPYPQFLLSAGCLLRRKKNRSFVSEVNTYINRFGQVNPTVPPHARLYEF